MRQLTARGILFFQPHRPN